MQNTFSQSGNDSKWFLTKIIFQNSLMANETPSRPPPLHGKCHLKFPFWLFAHFPKRLCQSVSAIDIFNLGLPSASFHEKSLTGNFSLVIFVKIQLFCPTHNMELTVLCFPRVANVCAALLGRKVPSLSCWLVYREPAFKLLLAGNITLYWNRRQLYWYLYQ